MSNTNDNNAEKATTTTTNGGYVLVESVTTKKKGNLLHPMKVHFPEGCVTAIFGPSGAGKTTLLDFMTGNVGSGVNANGEVNLPGSKAYVPQEDALHGFYTCQQYMNHYTRLSGGKVSDPTNEERIGEIFESLGLKNHKDTIVGDIFLRGLSGGQKRRLSVALETLSNPQNFFLDEPTSGLDAESAFQVMKFLRHYVRQSPGRRVILTIHQPSSFLWQLIDNAVLLAKGKLMYEGSRSKMEHFFEMQQNPTPPEYNPADHYVTVVNDEFVSLEKDNDDGVDTKKKDPDAWAEAFEQWKSAQENKGEIAPTSQRSLTSTPSNRKRHTSITEEIQTSRGSSPTALLELTRRYFTNLFYNPGILGTRIAMYVMLSLLIGILFWDLEGNTSYASIQSRIALLFYCAAFFIFMSIAILPFTVIERGIVNKEVRNGYYHPVIYQAAQGISSLPGTAILSLLTTLIIAGMTGLKEPFWFFLNMFLALNCAEALAQLMSHIVPHFIIGMALVAGFYGLFMLLQGFMLIPSEFPNWLRWSHNIAFHTYSWRTFMYKEFHDRSFSQAAADGFFATGDDVLQMYEIEDVDPTSDMMVLIGYAAFIHLCSFGVLYAKHSVMKSRNANVVVSVTD